MPPVKKPCVMTSYGGIIRIRLKGRSSVTSSQPASQAPLYLFYSYYTSVFYECKCFHKNYAAKKIVRNNSFGCLVQCPAMISVVNHQLCLSAVNTDILTGDEPGFIRT